mgnify:CR=1 FL=1
MRKRIIVIDDNQILLESISMLLDREELSHDVTTSPGQAIQWIQERDYDLVISDMRMPEMTGLELMKMIKVYKPETEVIFITGYGSITSAVKAMSLGAYHYFTKPFANNEEFILVIKRALAKYDLSRRYQLLKQEMDRKYSFSNMVGQNEKIKKIYELIEKVAPSNAPVLIQGESGTGKELVARAIHERSRRHGKRFLAINTSSLPETLLESELFGYKKGAFTGATQDKAGLLETSEGGTVFLDEISSMSKSFQGKMLRAIQENEIIPIGGSNPVPINVRFISASNRNLKDMVFEGAFREDLYYRLNVIEITIPPLRERTDDLMLLIEHFLRKFCDEQGVPLKKFSNEALKLLFSYDYPGNIRELENIVRRAVIMSENRIISAKEIVLKKIDKNTNNNAKNNSNILSLNYEAAKKEVQEIFQKQYIENLLKECKGNISKASRQSGLSRQSLYKLINKYKKEKTGKNAPK